MFTGNYFTQKEGERYIIPGGTDCILYPNAITGDMSCAYLEMDGIYPEKGMRKNLTCVEAFFIIKGSVVVTLDTESKRINAGDVLYVPLNTPYKVEGVATIFVFINPSWDSEQNVAC